MGFGDVFKAIGKVALKAGAPMLASAIPGGGIAMNLIKDKFGVDPGEEDEGAIIKAIESDPEAAVKLKQIEAENKARLEEIAVEKERVALQEYQAELADKQSARQREISIVQATGKIDLQLYILSWTVIVGFFILLFVLMRYPLPENAEGYINQLFGALAAGFGMVLSYFFGSSTGSKNKDKVLADRGKRE